ncbi:bifunctional (p)ppGpp synthetase/guanosine-3',5'-bis(diphosphate) 3'-pyrophosphohydrolase [Pseudoalteromonas sp. FUC4]|uniref:HD domain-containing protein n=1 Tax=Pseudoalteromonas sp. FUC4 TaxID=2511201 RepID=UPI0011F25FCB|nr:HD domain-containing protein [Pseudoalteromonas sp. FUC4]KAA1153522.1 bifunctional (p)ppGpp synthetase/guanosine-3',5'-bis(diphosphate) 3'-pyrophosphohydrolase [Pseudoalteromonas sp. FUC4]
MSSNKLLIKSLALASKYHEQQKRKSDGSPYINHLIEVAVLLADIAGVDDDEELCAAILHDILEDTDVTTEEVYKTCGHRVLELVEALSDDKSLCLAERREETLKALPKKPNSVKRIKLADLCSNASAIPSGWTLNRQTEYLLWLDQVAGICKASSLSLHDEYLRRRANYIAK